MAENFWDKLMGTDEGAAVYMDSYGEGPGSETRFTIGKFINAGESVLDVGCGPGWNVDHFIKFGPKFSGYRGVDYSERFVRIANKRMTDNGFTSQPFYVGDCRKLEDADDSFDVVILQDILEHTNGYEKPVEEALRVARKRVIVTFWHLNETPEREHINDDGDDGYGAWYSKENWEKYLDFLPYSWYFTESTPKANRQHWFYVIYKDGIK